MGVVFTVRELMQEALMCLSNVEPDPSPVKTIYCRTCLKIVPMDEAGLVCFPAGHNFIEQERLFNGQPTQKSPHSGEEVKL